MTIFTSSQAKFEALRLEITHASLVFRFQQQHGIDDEKFATRAWLTRFYKQHPEARS